MLSLQELKPYYPENLQQFDRFIIREYLQYKILEIVFDSPYANQLAFLGGTCLRIVHNNSRFSEDLDFDNFNLSSVEFNAITERVKLELEKIGYKVEMRNVKKGAYHCYIRFPELLYNEGLSNHQEEKILIQLDTESHHYNFNPEKPFLNRFDVFSQISATPGHLLLAQKFYAVLNRKRNKGRDFFDILFLLGQGLTPDYDYLEFKLGISSPAHLRNRILEKCESLDMKSMADDVRPFLFDASDDKKVIMFPKYIAQANLG